MHKYAKMVFLWLAGVPSMAVKEKDSLETAIFGALGKGRKMANDGH